MTDKNLIDAAAAIDGTNKPADIKKVHCAVNHVGDGVNILVRIKELGTNSPSFKMPLKAFGEQAPVKGENFLAEIDNSTLFQQGQYLQGGNAKVISRDGGAEVKPFDMDAYMADLETAEVVEEDSPEAPFSA